MAEQETQTGAAQVEEQLAAPPATRTPPTLPIPPAITVHDLANMMRLDPVDVIKQLMRGGFMYTINEVVDFQVASRIAQSFGFPVKEPDEPEKGPGSIVVSHDGEDPDQLEERPPVVTILGHVDHGKTTLLDAIRKTNVVAGEAGGITQHIGAYQTEANERTITFLDTPGHEAFTAMRARGAQVTDIAILVVAADDGIMPQTLEAIDHVKAAEVPIVVAINKIDRPNADPERVKRQLSENDLLVEDWGGEVIAVPMSALQGEGVSDLLENIAVVAEVSDLKANPHRDARGVVVEARIDRSRGPVATVLVQTGTLHVGDDLVVGGLKGRVKAMLSDQGAKIKEAGPSMPAEILGIVGLPEAGDILEVVPSEKVARQMVEARSREKELERGSGVTLEDVHSRIESGEVKALNLILKTDVQGSVEAVKGSLERLSTERTKVNLIHSSAGSITEGDVLLGVASKAIIIGFNSRPEPGARTLAGQEGLELRFYDVIYNLLEDIEKALEGLLEPVYRDVIDGQATVRATFQLGRSTTAAGFYVNSGSLSRGTEIHVVRNGERVFAGAITSLKHFKDDVRDVATGNEGGLVLEGFRDFHEGDVLEAHRSERVGVA